jgi:hypothetical protein
MCRKFGHVFTLTLDLHAIYMAIDTYMHNIDLDTMQHAIVLLDLLFAIFVFCLIWLRLQVGAGGGVEGKCMHNPIANGQSLLRLRFNSLSSACNCSLFVIKCFLPLSSYI